MCFVPFPQKRYGPFFFMETTVTGMNYLNLLQLWLNPQLQEGSEGLNIQQGIQCTSI
jgi:hypothetical protein